MADLITIGFKADTTQLQNAQAQLNRTAQAGDRVDSSNRRIQGSSRDAGRAMAGVGRQAGQAGIQVQQFVGQVQGGVNPLLAMSQQATDLGIVLGAPLLGSIIGLGSALALALVPNLISADDQISELIDRIGELQRVSNLAADQTAFLATQNNERVQALSKENEAIAEQVEELERLQRARISAGVGTDTGQFAVPRSAEENQRRYNESIREGQVELERMRATITTNNQEIIRLNDETNELINGNGGASEATRELTATLEAQIFELENGSEQAALYSAALATGVDSIEDLDPSIRSLIERLSELKEAQSQESAFAQRFQREKQASEALARQLVSDYNRRVAAENRLSTSLERQIITLQQGEQAALEYSAAQSLGLQSIEDIPDAIQAQIDALIALRNELEANEESQKRLQRQSEQSAREIERAYERLTDNVSDGFETLFRNSLDGFDNFADSVVDTIKNMVARMIAEIATVNVFSSLGLGAGGATSVVGGLGGLLVGAGTGVLGNLGAGLATTTELLGSIGTLGVGSIGGIFGNIGSLLGSGGAAGIAAGIGAALPVAAITAIALPLVKNIIGGVGEALFGGSFETRSSGIQFGVQGGDFTGEQFQNQKRSGGLFRSSRRRTLTSSLDAELEAAFEQTFEGISSSVIDGLNTLGFDIADNALESFRSATKQIEFGEDEEANQAAVQAYFASLSDEVAAFAQRGGSDDFSNGVIDLIESGLSIEEAIDSFRVLQDESFLTFEQIQQLSGALSATNIVFEQLGVDAFEASVRGGELSQQLIEISGGIEAFLINSAKFANTFVDTRTDAEKLSDAFGELGLELPSTAESLVALVQSLDLTTEEGQRAFAVITALTDSLSQFYDEQERAAQEAVAAAERALIAAIDAEKERAEEVLQIARDEHTARIELINEQREAANTQLQQFKEANQEQQRLLDEQRNTVEQAFNALTQDLDTVQGLLRRSFSAEAESVQAASQERINGINAEIEAVQQLSSERLDSINAERSLLSDGISSLTGLANRLRQASGLGQVSVNDALNAARRGDFSLAENVDTSELGAQGFSTVADQLFANAVRQLQISEIAELAGEQASDLERQLSALDAQTATVQAGTDATLAALNQQIQVEQENTQAQVETLNRQLETLLGIDNSTVSIEEAIRQLQAAQAAIDEFGYEAQLSELDKQSDILQQQLEQEEVNHAARLEELKAQASLSQEQLDQAIQAHEDEIARLDAILNEALGLNEAVLSVEEAIRQLNEAIQALADAQGGESSEQSVPSAPPSSAEVNMNREMMTELRSIRDEIRAGNIQIGKNTSNTAGRLRNIELNGLETRQEIA